MINQTIAAREAASTLSGQATKSRNNATDEILLELWETKRKLNTQAQFDIVQLANQANAFNLENALRKLNLAVAH